MGKIQKELFVEPHEKDIRSIANTVRQKIKAANPPKLTDESFRMVRAINPDSGAVFEFKEQVYDEDGANYFLEILQPDYETEDDEIGLHPLDVYEIYACGDDIYLNHHLHMQDSGGKLFIDTLPEDYFRTPFHMRSFVYPQYIRQRQAQLRDAMEQESLLRLDAIDRARARELGLIIQRCVVVQSDISH